MKIVTAVLSLTAIFVALSLLTACRSASITDRREFTPVARSKPTLIYVADFELSAGNIHREQGLLSTLPGPAAQVGGRLEGASDDPGARARKLVDLMSESIVHDLTKAGFTATRLGPGSTLPTQGWLVRGVFTQVQEGNRLRRAMIGFGEGQTDIQVVAAIDDLSQGSPRPLYELDTEASSGNTPGAAPTLILGPYGAAARFVTAGNDLETNVKQSAGKIAASVADGAMKTEKPL